MTSPGRRPAAVAALLAAALALGACSGTASASPARPTPTVTATPTATPEPEPSEPTTVRWPLRGTEAPASAITGPALSAKVDNHPDARPQQGLERTDIVFEELVEGGLTRYVAVWLSDVPAEIGPVRSIRPMDPDIISPLGGVVAYSGGQQRFVDMMQNTPVHNAIHGGSDDGYMFRTDAKRAPHNVLVRAADLRAGYTSIAPPRPQFAYSLRPATASAAAYGAPASSIDVSFSPAESRRWEWDAASGTYLRSQNGRPDADPQGLQLRATNVVVMSVGIQQLGEIPQTMMVGSGPAWVSSGGHTVEAWWTKASRDTPIEFENARGGPISLAPGNTWVQLVPRGQAIAVNP